MLGRHLSYVFSFTLFVMKEEDQAALRGGAVTLVFGVETSAHSARRACYSGCVKQ